MNAIGHRRLAWGPTLLMIVILLGAAFLRLHRFADWPPGLSHDEAVNGIDALRILHTGTLPLYLRDGRPEPLFRYFQAVTVGLAGASRFGLRLASFYAGLLGVAAAYRAARHLAPHPAERRWIGLIAAATLAVMVGHVHLSRVAYRAILLPFTLLLFVDAFAVAARTGRARAFAAAGAWLGLGALTYTSGLMGLPLAALGLIHQAITRPRWLARHGRGVLIFVGVLALFLAPLGLMLAFQPDLYVRAAEVGADETALPWSGRLAEVWDALGDTWRSVYADGDINPQYNAAQTPLLHTHPLYWLALIGMAACLLRPRRPINVLVLGLVGLMLLPVALTDEIPHGLRIAGEFAALPLSVAAASDPVLWLAGRIPAGRAARAAWALGMGLVLGSAGLSSASIYFGYWQEDVRWGDGGVISAFTWFYETRRQTVAEVINQAEGPVYVPLSQADHPTLRFLTSASHPRVVTLADQAAPGGSLNMPGGTFVVPVGAEDAATYVAFMPDGRLTLLPQFDPATRAALTEALAAGRPLTDPYGERAGVAFEFPPDGGSLRWEQAIANPVEINFDHRIRLVGWDAPFELTPGDEVEVALYMARGSKRPRDYYVFAQLWTVEGERLAGDETLIHRWLYESALWKPGDVVPVVLALDIPGDLAPGVYHLGVGVYDARNRRLLVLGVDGAPMADAAVAGRLKVPLPPQSPPDDMRPVEAEAGGAIHLLGYRLESDGRPVEALSPGQNLSVTLCWQATARPDADYTAFVHVHDASGALIVGSDIQPEGGHYPTGIWSEGEVVTTVHALSLPPEAGPGPYTLYAGWYAWPDLERLPITQDGEMPEDRRIRLVTLDQAGQ